MFNISGSFKMNSSSLSTSSNINVFDLLVTEKTNPEPKCVTLLIRTKTEG